MKSETVVASSTEPCKSVLDHAISAIDRSLVAGFKREHRKLFKKVAMRHALGLPVDRGEVAWLIVAKWMIGNDDTEGIVELIENPATCLKHMQRMFAATGTTVHYI